VPDFLLICPADLFSARFGGFIRHLRRIGRSSRAFFDCMNPSNHLPHIRERARRWVASGLGVAALAVFSGCGDGSANNPLDNPPLVDNAPGTSQSRLSFAYYQRCVQPIFTAALTVTVNGVTRTSTCVSSGCHGDTQGRGGALRIAAGAQLIDVTQAANTPAVIRATEMYRNFASAQGVAQVRTASGSLLLVKPLQLGALHDGGTNFVNDQDPLVRRLRYWIETPVPAGQDEFSPAAYAMFTPADPNAGACNTP
jgi:hypothetical protein